MMPDTPGIVTVATVGMVGMVATVTTMGMAGMVKAHLTGHGVSRRTRSLPRIDLSRG